MSDAIPHDILLLYRMDLQEKRIEEMETHIRKLEADAAAREEMRRKEQRNQLVAGIAMLGGIVTTLGAVIWSYRSVIFQGRAG